MSKQGVIGVSIDDLRKAMLRESQKLIEVGQGLVEQYNDNDEYVINSDEAKYLFDAINNLAGHINLFLNCSGSNIEISNLSHLITEDYRCINYQECND